MTVTRQEDVYGWRDVVVGAKEVPDGTEEVPVYQTRVSVRMVPDGHRWVKVAKYREVKTQYRVKVGTKTVTKYKTVPVPERRWVKVGTRTATYTDPDPDKGTWRHDPGEHVCPAGQHMAPFPALRASRSNDETLYAPDVKKAEGRLVVAWAEVDSHTGCSSPVDPFAGDPIQRKTLWADLTDPIKAVAGAAVSGAGLVVRTGQQLHHARRDAISGLQDRR
ncbi:MAG: hypothetical protein OXF75_06650 [Acidimicrobiaceae bacterium]|nr:hypothetical protein [Acidimicrobiaceae bacterium]